MDGMDQNSEDSDGKRRDINGRIDPCTGRNFHLYIEYIEGGKSPKNKLYTRYTQEKGQVKLSKKEVMI